MTDVIKSGNLFKYSDSAFNSKWNYNYVELLRNSTIRWFEKKGDRTPERSVILKDVSSFLAFGDIVKQLPFKPDVKEEQINLIIAIPHDNNRNTKLTFFLCNNPTEMQEWVNGILDTISDQNNSQKHSTQTPVSSYALGANPPNPGGPYSSAPPNAGASYSGGPPNMGGPYPGAPPIMGGAYPGSYPGNQANINGPYAGAPSSQMPPYQGAPPPYQGGPSSGPPPIGFNLGHTPTGSYAPPPQSYPYPSYPQQQPGSYPQSQLQSYPTPYQAGTTQPYPVQQRMYAPGGQPSYALGNAPVSYAPQMVSQPPQAFVIVDGKKKKKKFKMKNAAIGLAAGAAGAYATHKMFHGYGHGWGGGWGHHGYGYDGGWGHHNHWGGSWSSLSSYDSWSD